MRVALVHDWLTGLRGGERCLQAFLRLYPQAEIFTLLHVPGTTDPKIDARVKRCSFIQKIPRAARWYRHCLPLYPLAIRSFDFTGYDLVISLSHAAAKNITVPRGVPHLCYCFTPMRYIWDQSESYFGAMTPWLSPVIRALRAWDYRASQRPDCIIGISNFVAARIRCFYGRRAEVIYPPVATNWIKPTNDGKAGSNYLLAGALVPYKKADLVIEAFNKLGSKLAVVGTGPDEERLRKMARSNITFHGQVTDLELGLFYRRARALLFPGTEDFGMVPIECMAAGRPVIGLYDGALKESILGIKPWSSDPHPAAPTGVFIRKERDRAAQVESIINSVLYFEGIEPEIDPQACINQAKQFSPERFFSDWQGLVDTYVGSVSTEFNGSLNVAIG